MGCRCNERGKLIVQAAKVANQPRRLAQRVSLVAKSAIGDVRQAQSRARARLTLIKR